MQIWPLTLLSEEMAEEGHGEVKRQLAEEEKGAATVAGVSAESAVHPPHQQQLDDEGDGQEQDQAGVAGPGEQGDGQGEGQHTAQGMTEPAAQRTTHIDHLVLGPLGRAGVWQLTGDEGGGALGGDISEKDDERALAAPSQGRKEGPWSGGVMCTVNEAGWQ